MKTRYITFFALVVLASASIVSQTLSPKISFKKTQHNFGDIKESDGSVKAEFEFTNYGQKPIIIESVMADCGCTSPEYPRQPILPGKSAIISTTFDPANRPGRFVKSVTVSSNTEPKITVLTLSGNVLEREPTIEDIYPYAMGTLRLDKTHVSFLKMDKSEIKENSVAVINNSKTENIELSFQNTPAHIEIKSSPAVLKPGQKGEIKIKYNANKVADWGFVLDRLFVVINKNMDYNNRLSVSVNIEENFEKLSPQELANAPKAVYENPTFNFGSLKEGQKIDYAFKLKNEGKSNLIIRNIKPSCGCTAISPEKTMIAPGESTEIKMVFDSKGTMGRQYKTITVITNAPNAPTTVLKIIGTVN
jgi:hypothetical protein